MQFITNGPDIPNALLQAQSEGKLVFFCGAGISASADLPLFKGLVEKIYESIDVVRNDLENSSFGKEQYDTTLDLLERRIGNRFFIRKNLIDILKPNLNKRGSLSTHRALLNLSRSANGNIHLVTTNFDRLFEVAAKKERNHINYHYAPFLPIPKNSRWDGVVYLHGRLPEVEGEIELNRLVLTSGDFGLAYLTERWASRFVTELFRCYVVCFVGYRINDPVLKYMMDALAADRMLGEVTPQAYAFASCEVDNENNTWNEWDAKGVTPILYHSKNHDHSLLHKTLTAWSKTYVDGILGKESLVTQYALAQPSSSTKQDDYVGRMQWAISDSSGLPAKKFAEFTPTPSLNWLYAFNEACFKQEDLPNFLVSPDSEVDKNLKFSLINRPSPYSKSSYMSIFEGIDGQWDEVMLHLSKWLLNYLNDPEFVIWVAARCGKLHPLFKRMVSNRLNESDKYPMDTLMYKLWGFLLIDKVSNQYGRFIYPWINSFNKDGLTVSNRVQLRAIFSPKILISKPYKFQNEDDNPNASLHSRINCEVVFESHNARSALRELNQEKWVRCNYQLVEEFQSLLLETLDFMKELDLVEGIDDYSCFHMPSISEHWQNRGYKEWVVLIELLRDSWISLFKVNSEKASDIANNWFDLPYIAFKRLALHAASFDNCIDSDVWVNWLLMDDAKYLWMPECKREVMRLIVLQGKKLRTAQKYQIEKKILEGIPNGDGFRDDYFLWHRLKKLEAGGIKLTRKAKSVLDKKSLKNPDWRIFENQSDEFYSWMTGTGDPDYQPDSEIIYSIPDTKEDIHNWFLTNSENVYSHQTDWRNKCVSHKKECMHAMFSVSSHGIWPVTYWNDALYLWSKVDYLEDSWIIFLDLLVSMPDDVFGKVMHSLSIWLEAVSRIKIQNSDNALLVCDRFLKYNYTNFLESDRPVSGAINHPIGIATQVILNLWYRSEPTDNQLLPEKIKKLLGQLLSDSKFMRFGRVLLAQNLISLFRVDKEWTEKNFLQFFDWNNEHEARYVWEGFLWAPRLYLPLFLSFKKQFLSTADHYYLLTEHGVQYASLLAYAALEIDEGYSLKDFKGAFGVLPLEGLQTALHSVCQAFNSSGENREEYWQHRVRPFLLNVWPNMPDVPDRIVESLVQLCMSDKFPDALVVVKKWIHPIQDCYHVLHLLDVKNMSEKFPDETYELICKLIHNPTWVPEQLGKILDSISRLRPNIKRQACYKQLKGYVNRS